jgi:hypothetical protein
LRGWGRRPPLWRPAPVLAFLGSSVLVCGPRAGGWGSLSRRSGAPSLWSAPAPGGCVVGGVVLLCGGLRRSLPSWVHSLTLSSTTNPWMFKRRRLFRRTHRRFISQNNLDCFLGERVLGGENAKTMFLATIDFEPRRFPAHEREPEVSWAARAYGASAGRLRRLHYEHTD